MDSQILSRKNWVFDLDNTLYPAENKLFKEMNVKMRSYIMELLNLDSENAHKIQKQYLNEYGTSLAGLIANHDVNPLEFLEYVHDLDYSVVEYNEKLKNNLSKLDIKKYIATNGTNKHTANVLEKLKLENIFVNTFDIIEAGFIPKPKAENYKRMLDKFGIEPNDSVFFEDMAKNLVIPKQMGFKTVFVYQDETFEQYNRFKDYIDYKTDDLSSFLNH